MLLILADAGAAAGQTAASGGGKAAIFERMQGLAQILFREVEDGIAGGALVGGGLKGVQRERIEVRRGDLFFDQGAEHAEFIAGELHGV